MEYTAHSFSRAAIAAAVEVMFDLRDYLPEHPRERMVPDGRMHLVIELDGRTRFLYDGSTGEALQECSGAWLSGVHSSYITIGNTDQESQLLAVQFAPGHSALFTHRPASDSCDAVVPAEEVFGQEVVDLRSALLGVGSAADRLERVEDWLAGRLDGSWSCPDSISAALDALQRSPAELRWTTWVSEHTSLSYKHFLGLFKRHVGPSPKVMQRILRFSAVFQRIRAGEPPDWAALSLDLGYADQAHFVREFSAFSGYRPTEFIREGHDGENFFPEDAPGPE